ncbi:hypothetical protein NQ317_019840 [Molorchus minor]|uniref:Uncharacterized protein n=1 Tax=Molorchus minor TaxID=1323400 RepID=A0ABQ9J9U8_9CUCU|nr:hypothetical protein NQ317_019840 [Molorchus minor]
MYIYTVQNLHSCCLTQTNREAATPCAKQIYNFTLDYVNTNENEEHNGAWKRRTLLELIISNTN